MTTSEQNNSSLAANEIFIPMVLYTFASALCHFINVKLLTLQKRHEDIFETVPSLKSLKKMKILIWPDVINNCLSKLRSNTYITL